jgi:transposase
VAETTTGQWCQGDSSGTVAAGPEAVIRQLAAQLGVPHEALRNWFSQDQADRGERDDQPTSSESEELRRLPKENAEPRAGQRS